MFSWDRTHDANFDACFVASGASHLTAGQKDPLALRGDSACASRRQPHRGEVVEPRKVVWLMWVMLVFSNNKWL
jgi:hypothetical protein